MQIRIKKIRDDAVIPTKGTAFAAGADLYACIDEGWLDISSEDTVLVHTGIAVEIPEGYAGLILARSGLATKKDLAPANKVGLIDSDYRGEIMVSLHNHGPETQTIENHERIAQLVIVPYIAADFIESAELSETVRGEGGFGSTGEK